MSVSGDSKSVLILGGGVAGLQTANDLASLGFRVVLLERSPSIGGRMAQLDKTFPTNDCSMCILAPKMIECASHPNVTLLTNAEIESLSGNIRGFKTTIRKHSGFVNDQTCTGCGECATVCPVSVPNEFEMNISERKAIYKPFPQAVPNVFSITKHGISPCKGSCPANLNAQGYVQLVKQKKFDEALQVIHDTMPFAGTIGRICPCFCEEACVRGQVDDQISIAALKRAAAEFGEHTPEIIQDKKERNKRNKKAVAIIGAGPAGLTAAYNLARKGYSVTVFEKLPMAGGMLRVGVPAYRLPRDVLEHEIDLVRNLGVTIKSSSPVKGENGIEDLFKKGFKAVFIATGAHEPLQLRIPGENLSGVVNAVDFLYKKNMQQPVKTGSIGAVIGGGNAAIDAARTLLRMGLKKVSILYRRTRAEMPALSHEVDAAFAEGINIKYLCAPIRINGKSGQVSGLEAVLMRLGKPDNTGRRRPLPIEGSEFLIDCDMVIPAVGQIPHLDFIGKESKLRISRQGTIETDIQTCATSMKGVFAGGDVVTGPATAIEAIAAGNSAAESIHRYLQGQSLKSPKHEVPVVQVDKEQLIDIEKIPRIKMPQIPIRQRRRSFQEVERGYKKAQASSEAERCLNCAACCECLECQRVCEANAVNHQMTDERISLRFGAVVVATGFNMMDVKKMEEYGGGKIRNVFSGLEFERLLSASGPTGGHILRPSDNQAPKRIAFIQCVGSRDIRNHAYCSAVCCMHATKEAMLANEHDKSVSSTIFYTDLRAAGKTFQEYVLRAQREYSVSYVRSRPALLEEVEETGDVRITYEDTTAGEKCVSTFDMVVLCQALIPSGTTDFAKILDVELDENGFIHIPDPLLAPVDTTRPGVYAVGFISGPQDIPESVVQASAAAGRVAEVLNGGECHE